MSTAALRWGVGLAATGFAAVQILSDGAHRSRIRQQAAAAGHTPTAATAASSSTTTTVATIAKPAPSATVQKLHIYDHCPFCVRVQLVAGWNGIPHEVVVYGYGDVEGPKKLTGKKLLPVLEYTDRRASRSNNSDSSSIGGPGGRKFMLESLDIIKFLESLDERDGLGRGTEAAKVDPIAPARRPDLVEWVTRMKPAQRALTRGAMLKMPIKDFATRDDIIYSVNKYAGRCGHDYVAAAAHNAEHLRDMEVHLNELDGLLHSEVAANPEGRGMDDVLLLPNLRTLTCVKDLRWPPRVRAYVERNCADAGLNTYFAHAV